MGEKMSPEYATFAGNSEAALRHVVGNKLFTIPQLSEIGRDESYIRNNYELFLTSLEDIINDVGKGAMPIKGSVTLEVLEWFLELAKKTDPMDTEGVTSLIEQYQAVTGVVPGMK